MSATVLDNDYESTAAKPPISLHPAFPAIVALWFAALLGIGSMVLPAVLLDRLVSATGIGSLIPAANPPLGMTARSIIAFVGALAGAALGIAVARRVAQAHEPKNSARVAKLAGGARRPISVHDELGGEGVVNGESLPINRRRALAISEDDRPSDFLYRAPLPGEDPDAPAPFAAAAIVAAEPDDPLELSQLAQADADESDGTLEMTDTTESPSAWPTHQHFPREPEAGERETRNNFAGPRGFEPLPFAAPSLARRVPPFEAEPEEVQLEAVALPEPATERTELRADWESAPLDGLGLVQLVQRLGSTIERRRDLMAQAAVQPLSASAGFADDDLEPAAAEEAVQAMAAFFGSAAAAEPESKTGDQAGEDFEPSLRPEFLHPLPLVEEEEDAEGMIPDFSLPLRRPVAAVPASAPADNDADADEDEESAADTEEGYSSLLGMNNPFAAPKSEFVRIEEPEQEAELAEPAVVFPGQDAFAPPSGARPFDPPGKTSAPAAPVTPVPADADAALRSALATLQRMSGAA